MTWAERADTVRRLRVEVEPEYQLLSGGLQPFLFRSAAGTLVVQAQLPYPAGYPLPSKNIFPGLPGTAVSRDGGEIWGLWRPGERQGQGPVIEGAVVQRDGGAIRVFDWIADGPSSEVDYTGTMWETGDE